MTLVAEYLDKAARSLDAASLLLASGYPDLAVSRAYYGAFYVATALLLVRGLEFRRHGSVIAQFGLYYARPGVVDARFHHLLRDGFRLRQEADYGPR